MREQRENKEMNVGANRSWRAACLAVCLVLPCPDVWAQAEGLPQTLSGTLMVQDSGSLMISGRTVALWGIETLACDQQCWHDDKAWSCGEQATFALKHFAEGKFVKCVIKDDETAPTPSLVQCFVQKGPHEVDLAHFLVRQGLALDEDEDSDGFYAEEQEEARLKRRGIWTSRFQTAEDWRNGVQEFVEYEMAPGSDLAPDGGKAERLQRRHLRSLSPGMSGEK